MWMVPMVLHLSGEASGTAQPSIEGGVGEPMAPVLPAAEPIVRS